MIGVTARSWRLESFGRPPLAELTALNSAQEFDFSNYPTRRGNDELEWITKGLEQGKCVTALMAIEPSALWRDACGISAVGLAAIHKRKFCAPAKESRPDATILLLEARSRADVKAGRLDKVLGKLPPLDNRGQGAAQSSPDTRITEWNPTVEQPRNDSEWPRTSGIFSLRLRKMETCGQRRSKTQTFVQRRE